MSNPYDNKIRLMPLSSKQVYEKLENNQDYKKLVEKQADDTNKVDMQALADVFFNLTKHHPPNEIPIELWTPQVIEKMVDLLFGNESPFPQGTGQKFLQALKDAKILYGDDPKTRATNAAGVVEVARERSAWNQIFNDRGITPLSIETFKIAVKYCSGEVGALLDRAGPFVPVARPVGEAGTVHAAATQKASQEGGKKSRRKRTKKSRTIGGKKSRRRLRKRRTIKGGKRKRRRTRRRR